MKSNDIMGADYAGEIFVLIAGPIPTRFFMLCLLYAASYMALENVARFMGSGANCQPSIIRNLYIDYTHLTAELWPTFSSFEV